MSLFLTHNLIDINHIPLYKIKNRILRGYVHPPPGFTGMQFFNVTRNVRVIGQTVDMFTCNTTILVR